MRRANLFPALVMLGIQAVVALVLGIAATLLVRLAGTTATTIVLVVLLALFFYVLLTFARAVPITRRWGPWARDLWSHVPRWPWRRGSRHRGNGGRGGGSAGVREPRRPRWPGFPPRSAAAEPEGAERTV